MGAETNDVSARERRVNEVIAAFLEAVDAGDVPDTNELLAQHQDIADELEAFFGNRDQMMRRAEAFSAARNPQVDDLTLPLSNLSSDAEIVISPAPGQEVGASYFGDYQLLSEIARGGMGAVFQARQISLNRIVALKMILAGQLASKADVQRFRSEAEAAANLDHPGIVPIYEVGEHAGQHYFSMGYIDGQSLAERLRAGPLPVREAAELLKQVCEAVQYAHEHDVIHRDLKPANILLESSRDSRVASGDSQTGGPGGASTAGGTASSSSRLATLKSRPRITDFGLAKRLTGDSHLTATGEIVGTPGYMSPEQAAGETDRVGPASDVYSLGAILYQLLTGRPPFQAETPLDTLMQVLDSDPVPPRLLNRDVPRELEAICMKCLEKSPAHRYASAGDVGAELQRYLEGEPIQASRVHLLDRMTRALTHSRHEEQVRDWGLALMAFGLVIFLSHIAIFVLDRATFGPLVVYWLPRSLMFAILLIMLWRFRHHSILPTNSAERLIWVVWIGYLLALGSINIVRTIQGDDQKEFYASLAVLSGFGFLIMGGHVWGGGYVVGLVFMIAAPVLAIYTEAASLAFGTLWAAALLTFGLYYWRRGRAAQAVDQRI